MFDGRYEFGFIATNGCQSASAAVNFFDEPGVCETTIDLATIGPLRD